MVSSTTRWSVIWWSRKQKSLIETEFGCDLASAMEVYKKAAAAKAPMLTLRSMNTGWAPPTKYQPRQVKRRVKQGRRKVIETHTVVPIHKLNLHGLWWCPYCMTFRKFKKQDQVTLKDGSVMDLPGYYCPICGVSHRDGHVKKWNPVATSVEATLRTRRPRGRTNRTRRRRTGQRGNRR